MDMKKLRTYSCCLLAAALTAGNLAAHMEPAMADTQDYSSESAPSATPAEAAPDPVPFPAYTWNMDEDGRLICTDENGIPVKRVWAPVRTEDGEASGETSTSLTWYYAGPNSTPAKGKWCIGDQTYFFDQDGRMLTGWVSYEDGQAEPFKNAVDEDAPALYYCTSDGYMVKNCFMSLTAPEEHEDDFDAADDLEGTERWYYFDSKGRLKRNCKVSAGGADYCLSKTGKMLTGWVFHNRYAEDSRWIAVDGETDPEAFDEFKSDMDGDYVKSFYYCDETGAVVKDSWITTMPYDEAISVEPLKTKFRFGKDGTLVSANPDSSGIRLAKSKDGGGSYSLKSFDTPAVLKEIDGKTYAFDKNGKPIKKLVYISRGSSRYKKGFYCFNDANAACVGEVQVPSEEESRSYSYYFAEKSGNGYSKGQGYSGIHNGKLYYQGLAVQADPNEEYELVYVEGLDRKSNDTGIFIVDENGKIQKGSIRLSDGYKYQIKKAGTYGYHIYRIESDKTKTEITPEQIKSEDSDGTDARGDGMYRYVAEFELSE